MKLRSSSSVQKRHRHEAGLTLVELLIAMSILAVVTTMVLMNWFALQRSYAYTMKNDQARVDAREAVTRMVMEIRSAQALPGKAVLAGGGVDATSEWIDFWTTFNHPDELLLTRYVYRWGTSATGVVTGSVYRMVDVGSAGQREWLVVSNVINGAANPVFQYLSVDAYGNPSALVAIPTSQALLARVSAVKIHLRVDLNPGKSPTYMDIKTTAQLRNQRQF
jgi:prepilin-type N-terminal cleavage/methylation domain-containing protein